MVEFAAAGQRREVVVETGLDERAGGKLIDGKVVTRTRHARTRIVDIERHGEAFLDLPEVGDPWEPLTVRARLERTAEAYGHLPKAGPRKNPKSCMPIPVRQKWIDAAKEEGQSESELDQALDERDDYAVKAAHQVVDALPAGDDVDAAEKRLIAWAIAQKKSDRWLGRKLGCHNMTAAKRKQEMLATLADEWNRLDWRPDAIDVKRARRFLHNNI